MKYETELPYIVTIRAIISMSLAPFKVSYRVAANEEIKLAKDEINKEMGEKSSNKEVDQFLLILFSPIQHNLLLSHPHTHFQIKPLPWLPPYDHYKYGKLPSTFFPQKAGRLYSRSPLSQKEGLLEYPQGAVIAPWLRASSKAHNSTSTIQESS
jgi:hypothetical protein